MGLVLVTFLKSCPAYLLLFLKSCPAYDIYTVVQVSCALTEKRVAISLKMFKLKRMKQK